MAETLRPIDVRLPEQPLSLNELRAAVGRIRAAYSPAAGLPEPLWAQSHSRLQRLPNGQYSLTTIEPQQRIPQLSHLSAATEALTRDFLQSESTHLQSVLKLAEMRSKLDRTQVWEHAQHSSAEELALLRSTLQERSMDLGRLQSMNTYIDALQNGFLRTAERYLTFCSTDEGGKLREQRLKTDKGFREFEVRLAGMLVEFELLIPLVVKLERVKLMETILKDDQVAIQLEATTKILPANTTHEGVTRPSNTFPIRVLQQAYARNPAILNQLNALVALNPSVASYTLGQATSTFRKIESVFTADALQRLQKQGGGSAQQGLQNQVGAIRVTLETDAKKLAEVLPDNPAPGAQGADKLNHERIRGGFNRNADTVATGDYSAAVQKRLFDLFRIGENFQRPNGAIADTPSRLIDNQFMALATAQRDVLIGRLSNGEHKSVADLQTLFELYEEVTNAAMDHLLDNTGTAGAMLTGLLQRGQIGPDSRTANLSNPNDLASIEALAKTAQALPEPAREDIDAEFKVYAQGLRNYSADIQSAVKINATVISSVRTQLLNFAQPIVDLIKGPLVGLNNVAWYVPDALRIGPWIRRCIRQTVGQEWAVDTEQIDLRVQEWLRNMESLPTITERFTKSAGQSMGLMTNGVRDLEQIHTHVPLEDMALEAGEVHFQRFYDNFVRNPVNPVGKTPAQLEKEYGDAANRSTDAILLYGENELGADVATGLASLFKDYYSAFKHQTTLERENKPVDGPERVDVAVRIRAIRSAIMEFAVQNFYSLQFALEIRNANGARKKELEGERKQYLELRERRKKAETALRDAKDVKSIQDALTNVLDLSTQMAVLEEKLRKSLIDGPLSQYQKLNQQFEKNPGNAQLNSQVSGLRSLAMLLSERTAADVEQIHLPLLHLRTRVLMQDLSEKVKGHATQLNDMLAIRDLTLSILTGAAVTAGIPATYVLLSETLGRFGRYKGVFGISKEIGTIGRIPYFRALTWGRYNPLAIVNGATRPVGLLNLVTTTGRGLMNAVPTAMSPFAGFVGEILHDIRYGRNYIVFQNAGHQNIYNRIRDVSVARTGNTASRFGDAFRTLGGLEAEIRALPQGAVQTTLMRELAKQRQVFMGNLLKGTGVNLSGPMTGNWGQVRSVLGSMRTQLNTLLRTPGASTAVQASMRETVQVIQGILDLYPPGQGPRSMGEFLEILHQVGCRNRAVLKTGLLRALDAGGITETATRALLVETTAIGRAPAAALNVAPIRSGAVLGEVQVGARLSSLAQAPGGAAQISALANPQAPTAIQGLRMAPQALQDLHAVCQLRLQAAAQALGVEALTAAQAEALLTAHFLEGGVAKLSALRRAFTATQALTLTDRRVMLAGTEAAEATLAGGRLAGEAGTLAGETGVVSRGLLRTASRGTGKLVFGTLRMAARPLAVLGAGVEAYNIYDTTRKIDAQASTVDRLRNSAETLLGSNFEKQTNENGDDVFVYKKNPQHKINFTQLLRVAESVATPDQISRATSVVSLVSLVLSAIPATAPIGLAIFILTLPIQGAISSLEREKLLQLVKDLPPPFLMLFPVQVLHQGETNTTAFLKFRERRRVAGSTVGDGIANWAMAEQGGADQIDHGGQRERAELGEGMERVLILPILQYMREICDLSLLLNAQANDTEFFESVFNNKKVILQIFDTFAGHKDVTFEEFQVAARRTAVFYTRMRLAGRLREDRTALAALEKRQQAGESVQKEIAVLRNRVAALSQISFGGQFSLGEELDRGAAGLDTGAVGTLSDLTGDLPGNIAKQLAANTDMFEPKAERTERSDTLGESYLISLGGEVCQTTLSTDKQRRVVAEENAPSATPSIALRRGGTAVYFTIRADNRWYWSSEGNPQWERIARGRYSQDAVKSDPTLGQINTIADTLVRQVEIGAQAPAALPRAEESADRGQVLLALNGAHTEQENGNDFHVITLNGVTMHFMCVGGRWYTRPATAGEIWRRVPGQLESASPLRALADQLQSEERAIDANHQAEEALRRRPGVRTETVDGETQYVIECRDPALVPGFTTSSTTLTFRFKNYEWQVKGSPYYSSQWTTPSQLSYQRHISRAAKTLLQDFFPNIGTQGSAKAEWTNRALTEVRSNPSLLGNGIISPALRTELFGEDEDAPSVIRGNGIPDSPAEDVLEALHLVVDDLASQFRNPSRYAGSPQVLRAAQTTLTHEGISYDAIVCTVVINTPGNAGDAREAQYVAVRRSSSNAPFVLMPGTSGALTPAGESMDSSLLRQETIGKASQVKAKQEQERKEKIEKLSRSMTTNERLYCALAMTNTLTLVEGEVGGDATYAMRSDVNGQTQITLMRVQNGALSFRFASVPQIAEKEIKETTQEWAQRMLQDPETHLRELSDRQQKTAEAIGKELLPPDGQWMPAAPGTLPPHVADAPMPVPANSVVQSTVNILATQRPELLANPIVAQEMPKLFQKILGGQNTVGRAMALSFAVQQVLADPDPAHQNQLANLANEDAFRVALQSFENEVSRGFNAALTLQGQ